MVQAALSGRPGARQQITRVLLPKLPTMINPFNHGVSQTFQISPIANIFYLLLVTLCFINVHQINPLRPEQDGQYFADDIFICIFLNENHCILIQISLEFVFEDPTDN